MSVRYDKLWKILSDRNMMKTDLIREAKISTNAMAKLGRNEDVRVGILIPQRMPSVNPLRSCSVQSLTMESEK